jgi:mannose-6-phosphate isomerase-like protein (cupin superfamily)
MDAFELSDLAAARRRSNRLYLEFLRVPALSAGLYELPAGGVDPQRPHAEDEVYCVVSGRGSFRAGAEERAVGPGTVLFVKAGLEHRFHTITEDLTVLVFFAPAESA